jgi:quinol-cytochrome oxidoreductase complex cytochrome b subunit
MWYHELQQVFNVTLSQIYTRCTHFFVVVTCIVSLINLNLTGRKRILISLGLVFNRVAFLYFFMHEITTLLHSYLQISHF